jgi:hypothetical protein
VTISPSGSCAAGCEVAEIDRGGLEAEVTPGRPVEPEMDPFDDGVLCDHEPCHLRGIVLDPACEAAPLELCEQAELAELREPHRPLPATPDRRRRA